MIRAITIAHLFCFLSCKGLDDFSIHTICIRLQFQGELIIMILFLEFRLCLRRATWTNNRAFLLNFIVQKLLIFKTAFLSFWILNEALAFFLVLASLNSYLWYLRPKELRHLRSKNISCQLFLLNNMIFIALRLFLLVILITCVSIILII